MKLTCGPTISPKSDELGVILYGRRSEGLGSAGAAIASEIRRLRWVPSARAWDFLSIALAAVTADAAGHRSKSPDGWTREFEIRVHVQDPAFWQTQQSELESALAFLTTDRWRFAFANNGFTPRAPARSVAPPADGVVLLSGGLDSLIGAIDLTAAGRKLLAVSHSVRGDAEQQIRFATAIGGGLTQLQCSHNAAVPDPEKPPSQRARSIAFLAYGVLAATSTGAHARGETVPLYVCENGLIALNPPLTGLRIGSLSTRTAHPRFLRAIQRVVDAAGINVRIENPYALLTKGEMLAQCRDEQLIKKLASKSTSCGRYRVFKYQHCGRCVPCQIRRASFLHADMTDKTNYVFKRLGKNDADHRNFDDVRAVGLANAEITAHSLESWLSSSMSWSDPSERASYEQMVQRGMAELAALHAKYKVK
ncbi:MAG: 7-cyano-7-deazaguanine synthase [Kofleriaceae bacterium]